MSIYLESSLRSRFLHPRPGDSAVLSFPAKSWRKKDHFRTSAKFNRGKASKKLTSPRYFADSVILCNVFIADGIFLPVPRRHGFRGEEISHDSESDGTSPLVQIRLLDYSGSMRACYLGWKLSESGLGLPRIMRRRSRGAQYRDVTKLGSFSLPKAVGVLTLMAKR